MISTKEVLTIVAARSRGSNYAVWSTPPFRLGYSTCRCATRSGCCPTQRLFNTVYARVCIRSQKAAPVKSIYEPTCPRILCATFILLHARRQTTRGASKQMNNKTHAGNRLIFAALWSDSLITTMRRLTGSTRVTETKHIFQIFLVGTNLIFFLPLFCSRTKVCGAGLL